MPHYSISEVSTASLWSLILWRSIGLVYLEKEKIPSWFKRLWKNEKSLKNKWKKYKNIRDNVPKRFIKIQKELGETDPKWIKHIWANITKSREYEKRQASVKLRKITKAKKRFNNLKSYLSRFHRGLKKDLKYIEELKDVKLVEKLEKEHNIDLSKIREGIFYLDLYFSEIDYGIENLEEKIKVNIKNWEKDFLELKNIKKLTRGKFHGSK